MTAPGGPRHRHSPRVRRMAADHGITLDALAGTGPRGRVTPADVVAAARNHQRDQPGRPPLADGGPRRDAAASRTPSPAQAADVIRLTQLTTVAEVDLTRVAALRDRLAPDVERRTGGLLTLTTFLVEAAVAALARHPLLNASVGADGRTAIQHPRQHVGVTVSTMAGPLTPVLPDAGALSLMGLARRLTDLTDRAASGRLAHAEVSGATFTLTCIADHDVLLDTPLVSPPQVAALSIGAPVERPVVSRIADQAPAIAFRLIAYLALSYDPRLLGSADTARFLADIKSRLQAAEYPGVTAGLSGQPPDG